MREALLDLAVNADWLAGRPIIGTMQHPAAPP
jgi:hypothetical protein